jgi:hypothetical protein
LGEKHINAGFAFTRIIIRGWGGGTSGAASVFSVDAATIKEMVDGVVVMIVCKTNDRRLRK